MVWVKPRLLLLVFLITLPVAYAMLAAQQAPAPAGAIVFEGARLIVGDGSAPIENSAFVVANRHFTEVGRKGQIQAPAGAARVDLTGKSVIPAMIDLHTHIGYYNYANRTISKEDFTRENLIDHLNRAAYYGFAAVQSLADLGDLPFKLRDETIPNASLFRTAGRGLAYPGSGPTGDSVVRNDVPYSITTAEQGRAAVRDLAPRKPSFIKIWVDDRNGTKTKLSPEMYAAIIDEAHKNNLGVIAHVYSVGDVKGLIRAGVDGLFHGGKDIAVDDELLALLKQHPGVWLAPGGGARADADLTCSNFRKLKSAGQKMVLGSDSQPGPQLKVGLKGHQELVHLVDCAGLTPAEAIVAATRDTAALLKLDELGTVARGKSADFIVLDADPLQNIANSQRISMVYLRGEKVDRAGLEAKWKAQGSQY